MSANSRDQGASIVIDTVAVRPVGYRVLRVLKNSRAIGHQAQVLEIDLRQAARTLAQGIKRSSSRFRRILGPRLLEQAQITATHFGHDHRAAILIGRLSHFEPLFRVIQELIDLTRGCLMIPERNQPAPSVG